MASVFASIAASVRSVVAGVAGAPATVLVRDADVVHPGETPCAIVTLGAEYEIKSVSGAGTDADQGDRLMAYEIGVSVYEENLGANQTLGDRQGYVLRCQQALNKKTLAGVPSVYGTRLERRTAWEGRPFTQGVEKSVFVVIFFSAETRLGN